MAKITVTYTFEDKMGFYGKHNEPWEYNQHQKHFLNPGIESDKCACVENIADDLRKLSIHYLSMHGGGDKDLDKYTQGLADTLDTIKINKVSVEP